MTINDQGDEQAQIPDTWVDKCPQCGSTDFRCWDESDMWFQNAGGELLRWPVGFLACNQCNDAWISYVAPEGYSYVGDDHEAGLDEDDWYD
jgi:hypothetical protein